MFLTGLWRGRGHGMILAWEEPTVAWRKWLMIPMLFLLQLARLVLRGQGEPLQKAFRRAPREENIWDPL
jgi:hypothetical protein